VDLSACIEWQYAEAGEALADRIRAASNSGLRYAEFHLWRDKDLKSIESALAETGVVLTGICVDPRRSIVDPAERDEFLAAVQETIEMAKPLGSPPLIIASGFRVEGMSEQAHFDNAVTSLRAAADMAEEAEITLVLEPLNTELFAAMYLVSTSLGLDLIEAVGSPRLKLLYDAYHSRVMSENMREVLTGRMHLVEHVQVAGYPGRNEPGTGDFDCAEVVQILRDLDYTGRIGLEYFPTRPSEASVADARKALGL